MAGQSSGTIAPRTTPPAAIRPSAAALFAAFLRLGLTAFGGPAMVPYIRELAVVRKGWLDERCFQAGVALCQSIPGATAMQTAAYVGLRSGGLWGGLCTYVGFGLPAFLLMVILSAAYSQTRDLRHVHSAFQGLQVIVVALVANATVSFGRAAIKDWRDVLLAAGAALFLLRHGSPVIAIVAAAGLGWLLYRDGEPSGEGRDAGSATVPLRAWLALPISLAAVLGVVVLWFVDRRLSALAELMLKVDLFAFGGGYASVPLMFHAVVDARGWLDSRTLMDGIVLGQITPGPIVITATFVGYQVAGPVGALVGTVSVFTPSFVLLVAVVPYFDRLQRSTVFRRGVRGALLSFVGLLFSTAVHFGTAATWTVPSIVLAALAFAALRLKVDIVWVVLGGGVLAAIVL